ncbi:MAG: sterol desaturase family protein [Cellulophaga sp.]
MAVIYNYFETISSLHRSLILISGITFFWILELILPLFQFKYKKWKHAGVNIFFTLTTILVNFPLAFLLLKTNDWTISNNFGLLQWLPNLSIGAKMVIGVLLLDLFSAWLAHWTEHKIKVLWGFHLIHHTDNHIDTTSANRHHPGESLIRFSFTCFGTFVVGAPIAIIMLYQGLSVVSSQFTHANISLPKKVDRILSWVLVSPDMHKVHHHYKLPYTDSNYGNIFSIWDRIFGTFMVFPREEIVYGVDTYPDITANADIKKLLKIPFKKYKSPEEIGS